MTRVGGRDHNGLPLCVCVYRGDVHACVEGLGRAQKALGHVVGKDNVHAPGGMTAVVRAQEKLTGTRHGAQRHGWRDAHVVVQRHEDGKAVVHHGAWGQKGGGQQPHQGHTQGALGFPVGEPMGIGGCEQPARPISDVKLAGKPVEWEAARTVLHGCCRGGGVEEPGPHCRTHDTTHTHITCA